MKANRVRNLGTLTATGKDQVTGAGARMPMFMHYAAALLLVAAVPCPGQAQTSGTRSPPAAPAAASIDGWDQAKFGMPASAVRAAYPGAKPERIWTCDQQGVACEGLSLPNVSLGELKVEAVFIFSRKADELEQVRLHFPLEQQAQRTFEALRSALAERYGPLTLSQTSAAEAVRAQEQCKATFERGATGRETMTPFSLLTQRQTTAVAQDKTGIITLTLSFSEPCPNTPKGRGYIEETVETLSLFYTRKPKILAGTL